MARAAKRTRRSQLVEHVYDAILEPSRWSDFLRDWASSIGAVRPALFGHDLDRQAGRFNLALGWNDTEIQNYNAYYAVRNVLLKGGRHLLKSGTVRTSQMMCSRAEFERSEYYNDYLKPIGVGHGLGATIWREASFTYNLSVFRGPGMPAFTSAEMRRTCDLMPHLQRAIQIRRRIGHLELTQRAHAEALDTMPAGLVLVDASCQVVFSNRAAKAIADAADGLRVTDGRLTTERPIEARELRHLIGRAAAARAAGNPAGGGVMRVSRRSLGRPLSVLVTSLAIGHDFLVSDPPVAAVFVFDHDAPGESAESILVRLHGLSRAEARVVSRLLEGCTIERAADHLGISTHTARTHLKRALAKTGTNRQTDLLRRILTGPAVLRGLRDPGT